MSHARPSRHPAWRAFGGRYLIALVTALAVTVAGIVAVNHNVDAKIAAIDRVHGLKLSEAPAKAANFLIIGSDTRAFVQNERQKEAFGTAQEVGPPRSDTMMIVHVNPERKSSLLVSIPRDLQVEVPGLGREKINAAFNFGPQKVIDTIQANFDVPIHHYLEVDFETFRGIVDAIGSVPVYFPAPARDSFTGLNVQTAGCLHLNGQQALEYVRSRHLQFYENGRWHDASPRADIDRIQRQQAFIRRLASEASKTASRDVLAANQMADRIVDKLHVDENLSRSDIFALVRTFRNVNPADEGALEMVTMPFYTKDPTGRRGPLLLDEAKAAPILDALRQFGPPPEPVPPPKRGDIRVKVLNATGETGLAARTLAEFRRLGYASGGTGDAAPIDGFEVRFHPDDAIPGVVAMQALRSIEGMKTVTDDSVPRGEIVFVIGHGFPGIRRPGEKVLPPPTTASTVAPTTTTTTVPADSAAARC